MAMIAQTSVAFPDQSLTVIIAALNEEKNIEATVRTARTAVETWFGDYEILVFNDGSTDDTGAIAERIAAEDSRIRVVHHRSPRNLGGVFKEGLRAAKKDYVILINGKNDITIEALTKIFSRRDQAEIVIPYTINRCNRSLFRRFLSSLFVFILNSLFRLKLHYYNHSVLHRRSLVASVDIKTNSYAFQAEALIKLLKRGRTYVEVGVVDQFEAGKISKSFRCRNISGVIAFLLYPFYDVYLHHERL